MTQKHHSLSEENILTMDRFILLSNTVKNFALLRYFDALSCKVVSQNQNFNIHLGFPN